VDSSWGESGEGNKETGKTRIHMTPDPTPPQNSKHRNGGGQNLLFLIGKYPSFGGTEKVTTTLANEFFRRGHAVHIVSFEQPEPELIAELSGGIKFYPLSLPVKSEANLTLLRGIIVEQKIDAIINQWCLPYFVTQLCNKARKGTECKLIAVHHNMPDSNRRIEDINVELKKNNGFARNLFLNFKLCAVRKATSLSVKYVYHHSDRYVLLSESFVNVFQKLTGIKNADKLCVITNPVTLADNKFSYDKESKLKEIIYVGRIDYNQKKVYRIVNLWQEIENQYPEWKLTIVGDGEKRDEVENLVKTLNLKRIKIAGFQNPTEYYNKASIILLTSEYEGFPLVLAESMSFGVVPVVYGSYSAVYDIIESGKDGFVTHPPYSQQETVKSVKMLIDDEKLLGEMARNAVEKAKKFSMESILRKWEKLFDEIIKE
jgi:glycosyltransferase involved in cell wall biosynthesis